MNSNITEFLKTMTERDFKALLSIYEYRCLSFDQIYELNYKYSDYLKREVPATYFRRKFSKFLEFEVIQEAYSYDRNVPVVYFLTHAGVKVVKEAFNMPSNIYNEKKKVSSRGYQTAAELRVESKFIPHQYNLNEFSITLAQAMNFKDYYYEDERHTSRFSTIRPDGIFYTSSMDFFLEMDMGTETNYQLCEKWDHYRRFYNSEEFFHKEKPITIFFIVDNVKKVQKRIALIKDSINKHFIDVVSPDFDIYVDTKENLLKVFQDKYLKYREKPSNKNMELGYLLNQNLSLKLASGDNLKEVIKEEYMWYGRSENEGVIREYVIDDLTHYPTYGMRKIQMFSQKSSNFKSKTGRNIKYICLVDSIKDIAYDFDIFNVVINGNIYFTTPKLLESSKNISDAVRTFIVPDMTCCKFTDDSLKTYVRVDLTKNDI